MLFFVCRKLAALFSTISARASRVVLCEAVQVKTAVELCAAVERSFLWQEGLLVFRC